jgi:hypothetical protein
MAVNSHDISLYGVLTMVYKVTGYTGKKGGDIDKIGSTADDDNVLSDFMEEAISEVSAIASNYVSSASTSSITVEMPPLWDTRTSGALDKAVQNYIANYICSRWFQLSNKEEVKYYAALCDNNEVVIRRCLVARKKPTRGDTTVTTE